MLRRFVLVIPMVTMSVLVGLVLPANAVTTANVNITGTGKTAVFSPNNVTVAVSPGPTCDSTENSFSITNPTTKRATVTYLVGKRYKKLFVLGPNEVGYVCITTSGIVPLSLKADKTATLTATAS
jgi:hypothetical protein